MSLANQCAADKQEKKTGGCRARKVVYSRAALRVLATNPHREVNRGLRPLDVEAGSIWGQTGVNTKQDR